MTLKSYGWDINEEIIYLIESLKVEGYVSIKNREASIQNKDVLFLRRIERILRNNKVNLAKRIFVKVKPSDQDFGLNDVKILLNGIEIKHRIEYSPFDKSKKLVFNLPFKRNSAVDFNFKGENSKIDIVIKNQIALRSKYSAFAYLEIRLWNIKFLRFLEKYSDKWSSDNIRLNKILDSNKNFVASAFSSLVDCEGSLDHRGLVRRIRVRTKNFDYLNDWKILLNFYGIKSRLGRDGNLFCLSIEGFEDFNNLSDLGVRFFHSKKSVKWEEILKSYKRHQISRNSAKELYISLLRESNRPVTIYELSDKLDKSNRTVEHHLERLEKLDIVTVNRKSRYNLYALKNSNS